MEDAEKVSDYWGVQRRAGQIVSWLQHPTILANVHRRVSGDPSIGTYQYWKQTFFPEPAELCLSLGCGFGAFERAMMSIGVGKRFDAHDISQAAIEKAREDASAAGLGSAIRYAVTDLNDFSLDSQKYDAIFAISSAHHVYNLEAFFKECAKGLKPGALLFLDEYIGPTRFQNSDVSLHMINRLLSIMPKRLRRNVLDDDRVRTRYVNSPVEHFERTDPSEAIRSGEIVTTLKLYFDIVDFKPYGGAILHMLLSGLAGNFDPANETDMALLETLAILEEALEDAREIEPDFAAIVARPRTA